MKLATLLLGPSILLAAISTTLSADPGPISSTGPGNGVVQTIQAPDCGDLLFHSDGSYENGYCWRYGGVVAPYYGAFAECFSGDVEICSAVFDFTQTGNSAQTMDVYVWTDDSGLPGAVRCLTIGVDPGEIAEWPSISRHVVDLGGCCVEDDWWIGYWGAWPQLACGWFIAADTDGAVQGCPVTNIAPGIGFPTGWNDVSIPWGETASLGIGAEVHACSSEPGACCFVDGSCVVMFEGGCSEGEFLGDGSSCDPNPCSEPGACCFTDGTCTLAQPPACYHMGGGYQGDGVPCAPSPCPFPCVEARPLGEQTNPTELSGASPFDTGDRSGGGPNGGGTLFLHVEPGLAYTADEAPYCGASTLTDCDDAEIRTDQAEPSVFFVFAAFSPDATPRVAAIAFGVEYDDCLGVLDWGACGDFELPESGWPGSGTGTALTWNSPHTETLFDVYWFAAYTYYSAPAKFDLIGHPSQGAVFADDSLPAIIDPVERLGRLGFFVPGLPACPNQGEAPVGSCCTVDGCVVTNEWQCYLSRGEYQGDGTDCQSAPCGDSGACCFDVDCFLLTAEECTDEGGVFHGVGVPCNPNPCDIVPVVETTWGKIKSLYSTPSRR